jgi:hypothetical protein
MQSDFGMNDLNRALGDISSISRQVARSTEFRGYVPATLAATGGIAVLAAGVQAVWLPNPANPCFLSSRRLADAGYSSSSTILISVVM